MWVTRPGAEPWEVSVVKADSDITGEDAIPVPAACCAPAAGLTEARQGTPASCC